MTSALQLLRQPKFLRDVCYGRAARAATSNFTRAFCKGGMQDEYGELSSAGHSFVLSRFQLESGQWLNGAEVRYNSYGTLNESKDNVLVVCHALTGNSEVDKWWTGLLGPGKAFDTDKYLVVCANILGSCYGTTGPMSLDPQSKLPYLVDFPRVTVRDTVQLHLRLVKEGIGARKIAAVVGGSLGGMQALEWALCAEDFVEKIVPIACGGYHTAWQIGVSECQRQAIYADPKWCGGRFNPDDPPLQGLAVARQMAMVSYRTAKAFHAKFGRETRDDGLFQVRSYLEYQGEKFKSRMDPLSYLAITEQMDTHDVGRHRGGVDEALAGVKQPTLVIGIDSDILYPLAEQIELNEKIPNSDLVVVKSNEGHDGFLLEQEQIQAAILKFLN